MRIALRLVALALVIPIAGCAGFTRRYEDTFGKTFAGPQAEDNYLYSPKGCFQLRNAYGAWGGTSLFAASLAGASGVAATIPNDQKSQMAFAITTGTLAAISAATGFISRSLGEERANHPECGSFSNQPPAGMGRPTGPSGVAKPPVPPLPVPPAGEPQAQ